MEQTPVTLYSPESALRSPVRLFRAMGRDLLAARELAWCLFVRDLKVRYRQSILGFFWLFFPPLATTALFFFLNRQGILQVGSLPVSYPVFVMVGTLLWQLFIGSLQAPLEILLNHKAMLARVYFPREALLLLAMARAAFQMGITILLILPILWVFHIPLTWGFLLVPVLMFLLALLGLLIGLCLTPLGLLYTDVTSGLPILITLWFFATPVVYSASTQWPWLLLSVLNPVGPLLTATRNLVLGVPVAGTAVILLSVLTLVGWTVLWVVYRLSIPILMERVSV